MSGADVSATNTTAHTAETPQLLLDHHLKELRLPTILREYDKVARQCAVEQVDYQHYLQRVTELELLDRERRATERRIRQAKFPVVKTMDSFDFLAIPSVNKPWYWNWHDRSSSPVTRTCCCWATAARAKRTSHWLSAWPPASVGIRCALQPSPPWSASSSKLTTRRSCSGSRSRSPATNCSSSMSWARTALQDRAELLFEMLSQRYERGSTLVTSNLPFQE